jgi:hypothetical protein
MAKKPAPKKKAASAKPVKKSKPASRKAKPAKAAPPKKEAAKAAPKPASSAPEPKRPVTPLAVKTSGTVIPLTVSAQGAGGNAASGNTHPANILVVVSASGIPVTDLAQSNFTVMEHFAVPGQQYPFSNNIIGFKNAGSGAYLIQVKPINSAPWSSGHHLAQITVSTSKAQGQTAVKIIVR